MAVLPYVERTVQIRNQGSLEFNEEELAADIVLVDVRCTAIAGSVYVNKKTLPDYGYYGSVTLFGGATVERRIPLDFVYQRVLDSERIFRRIQCYLALLELRIRDLDAKISAPEDIPPVGVGELPREFIYRGLEYGKLKIKSLVTTQWEIKVRRYTQETGFACQSVSQSEDPTKGEDEYPQPIPIPDPNNFPAGLPNATPPYPGADGRDFEPASSGGNAGVGLMTYQFRDANSGPFTTNSIADIGYPGILLRTTAANGNREISWRDNEGVQTVLVEGASPPVQVRMVRVEYAPGQEYAPFGDSLSNPQQ